MRVLERCGGGKSEETVCTEERGETEIEKVVGCARRGEAEKSTTE